MSPKQRRKRVQLRKRLAARQAAAKNARRVRPAAPMTAADVAKNFRGVVVNLAAVLTARLEKRSDGITKEAILAAFGEDAATFTGLLATMEALAPKPVVVAPPVADAAPAVEPVVTPVVEHAAPVVETPAPAPAP
jgi:hypothetical protein